MGYLNTEEPIINKLGKDLLLDISEFTSLDCEVLDENMNPIKPEKLSK